MIRILMSKLNLSPKQVDAKLDQYEAPNEYEEQVDVFNDDQDQEVQASTTKKRRKSHC